MEMRRMKDTYEALHDYISSLEIIDSHEHLPHDERECDFSTDFIREHFSHYLGTDMRAAGLSERERSAVTDTTLSARERWRILEPYWRVCVFTGAGRMLKICAKDLYGAHEVSEDTIEQINEAYKARRGVGAYKRILKDACNIKLCLSDNLEDPSLDCDRRFFRSVYRPEKFIVPRLMSDVYAIERLYGVRIRSFEDWLEACEKAVDDAMAHGAVGLKNAQAYERTLYYERVTRDRAEAEFNKFFDMSYMPYSERRLITAGADFQNYMQNYVLKLADDRGLVYQFHTGMQSTPNILPNSNPALMCNLFLGYPNVKFHLLHSGHPYQREAGTLGKMFKNVFLDMSWAFVMSPKIAETTLDEWLDFMPYSKINVFGADSSFADGTYASLVLARESVARVLAQKVDGGSMEMDEAKTVAKAMFFDNLVKLFGLEKELEAQA